MTFPKDSDYKKILGLIDALCVQYARTPVEVISQISSDYQSAKSIIEAEAIIFPSASDMSLFGRCEIDNCSMDGSLPQSFHGTGQWLIRTVT